MAEIYYEDNEICILNKSGNEDCERLAESMGLLPVHRLDRTTLGLFLTAKTKHAACVLSKQAEDKTFAKTYTVTIDGITENDKGTLCDLLYHDVKKNKSFVVKAQRPGVKKAVLDYEVISRGENTTKLKINLLTGRTHQIRVQFASRKHPVTGDGRYGSKSKLPIDLCCSRMEFIHPAAKKRVVAEIGEQIKFIRLI